MPILYVCSSCGFKTSLGWFHYQNFDSGYGSQTNLTCKECGTRHIIQFALSRELQEESYKRANVVIDGIGVQPYEVRRILREVTGKNRHEADSAIASWPGIFVLEHKQKNVNHENHRPRRKQQGQPPSTNIHE